ncbi:MAG: hypothetical protein M2R45_02089 [Verrucomicrobia subdivision 3 bacterium]|nr:hypothetical protein [Limisphaerales bacterium]MCS1413852.1 hypothetical protein [Limisphaerales bacterium]
MVGWVMEFGDGIKVASIPAEMAAAVVISPVSIK